MLAGDTAQSRPVPTQQPGLIEDTAGTGDRPSPPRAHGRTAAYLSLLVTVFDAQSVHGPDDGRQRLDGVAVDHGLVLFHVFAREAIFVDDPRGKPHTACLMSALASPGNGRVRCVEPSPLPSSPQSPANLLA